MSYMEEYDASGMLRERYALVMGRCREIPGEIDAWKETLGQSSDAGEKLLLGMALWFRKEAEFLLLMDAFLAEKDETPDLFENEERAAIWNARFYEEISGENYNTSITNPVYLSELLGSVEHGRYLACAAAEIRGMIPYACEGRMEELTVLAELYMELYSGFEGACREKSVPEAESVRSTLYWYAWDYLELLLNHRLEEQLVPARDFAAKIIQDAGRRIEEGSADLSYLYRYGEYVSDTERKMAQYLCTLSSEEADRIAEAYTEGYRRGFEATGKDITIKRTVNIRYTIGFERIVARAIEKFRAMGLEPVIYRVSASFVIGRENRIGYTGGVANAQYEYDHREDSSLVFTRRYMSRKLEVLEQAYSGKKKEAAEFGGPAVIEFFGEEPFEPAIRKEIATYSAEQQKLLLEYRNKSAEMVQKYIKPEERSYTIIAFPTPAIGETFPEIFHEILEINTLDSDLYSRVQQKIIDVLDTGVGIHVTGENGNHTDLIIALTALTDPAKETLFENCVADQNIPVGEVFTSPKLEGTEGVLHVKGVFLEELYYRDLELIFEQGMVRGYSCGNFEDPEDGMRYVEENILKHHETLPMGEFAIGTNTLAYAVSRKYGIGAKMPILIAEKTGPHFAVGDTCYSQEEDHPMYNRDGKEVIARENSCSILRHTEPEKAYFHCHTDITIPYDELGSVSVIRRDGSEVLLLEHGRFVLPGTEFLNRPLG